MEKLISIILSLALVACMFGMTVGAVEITAPGTNNVVGTHGGNNELNNGVDANAFSSESAEALVKLTLGTANSKYAVDITFAGDYVINVAGLTWDVNNLVYVTTGATVENKEYTFTVTNYSDKSVSVVANGVVSNDVTGVSVEFNTTSVAGDLTTNTSTASTINCVITGNAGGDTTANYATFKADLKSTSWKATVDALVNNKTQTEFTLATFTVTVSK